MTKKCHAKTELDWQKLFGKTENWLIKRTVEDAEFSDRRIEIDLFCS